MSCWHIIAQELWALEKQRADLANETERLKQDNEFMEGEINTLRATVTEQMQQITSLKVRACCATLCHFVPHVPCSHLMCPDCTQCTDWAV